MNAETRKRSEERVRWMAWTQCACRVLSFLLFKRETYQQSILQCFAAAFAALVTVRK